MTSALTTVVLVATLAAAALAALACARGRAPGPVELKALLALQLVLIVQLGVVLYRLGGGQRPSEAGAFAGYVVLSLLLLPGGLALTADERNRWGSLALAVACLVVAVVELRLVATWG